MLGGEITKSLTFSRDVILTFDVEDFIDLEFEISSLNIILNLLKKYEHKAIFFITATMAEKLNDFPELVEKLKTHEIGYHSSSHSVKPRIFEYTDIEDYQEAIKLAMKRETKHIDPTSGEILGKGGILALRKIFPDQKVVSFRAPQCCWTPPHLEALKKIGFKFDFSADIYNWPIRYKAITFYPYPIFIDGIFGKVGFRPPMVIGERVIKGRPKNLLLTIFQQQITVLTLHPHRLMFSTYWDSISHKSSRNTIARKMELAMLEFLFLNLKMLKQLGVIETSFNLMESERELNPKQIDIRRVYLSSIGRSQKLFHYKPKFLFGHFQDFFQENSTSTSQTVL